MKHNLRLCGYEGSRIKKNEDLKIFNYRYQTYMFFDFSILQANHAKKISDAAALVEKAGKDKKVTKMIAKEKTTGRGRGRGKAKAKGKAKATADPTPAENHEADEGENEPDEGEPTEPNEGCDGGAPTDSNHDKPSKPDGEPTGGSKAASKREKNAKPKEDDDMKERWEACETCRYKPFIAASHIVFCWQQIILVSSTGSLDLYILRYRS